MLETKDFSSEQDGLDPILGENDVFFLPYLMGERSPHNDVNARGAFIGMRADTTRKQMTLAVLEGVAFALRDCIEVAKTDDLKIESTKLCGGGAKSKIWKTVIANVLGVPVSVLNVEEGPAYGASILAMVGANEYPSVDDAVDTIVTVKETVHPTVALTEKYEQKYRKFQKLYPALKDVF